MTPYQELGTFLTFKNPSSLVVNVWSYDGEKEGVEVRSIVTLSRNLVTVGKKALESEKVVGVLESDTKQLKREIEDLTSSLKVLKLEFVTLKSKYKNHLDHLENTVNILGTAISKERGKLNSDKETNHKKQRFIEEVYRDTDRKLTFLDAELKQKAFTAQKQSDLLESKYETLEGTINGAVDRANLRLTQSERAIKQTVKMSLESLNNSFVQHRDSLSKPLEELILIDKRNNRKMKICTINGNLSIEEV